MQNKLYDVVMLPINKEDISFPCLFRVNNSAFNDPDGDLKIADSLIKTCCNYFYLYITDPSAEICEGSLQINDIIYSELSGIGVVKHFDIEAKDLIIKYQNQPFIVEEDYEGLIQVIASTDTSLKLPELQQSFLQQYVKSQGAIKQVALEMEQGYTNSSTYGWKEDCIKENKLKIIDGCVVVIEEPEVITSGYLHTDLPKEPIEMYELPSQPPIEDVESIASQHFYQNNNRGIYNTGTGKDIHIATFKAGWQAAKDATEAIEFAEWLLINCKNAQISDKLTRDWVYNSEIKTTQQLHEIYKLKRNNHQEP